ncbi:RNA 2',3'-cyclic phosphodiesterase [Patescibacteria group bacterium]|nr:RNA 2',3'-cyclic phosphodiesterase [Patescibacteria group bacterium]
MKRRRIFIAINLPEDIKKKLAGYKERWPELPIKWTRLNNIHITLAFLGYIADEELINICSAVKEVASKHSSFSVNLFKICYGPLRFRSGQAPRMVWAIGEKSEEFASLKEDLDKSLAISEKRQFSSHITLGRIRKWEWQRIEPEERSSVDEEIDLNFSVDSIELMESVLKRGGPEYTILESYNLK